MLHTDCRLLNMRQPWLSATILVRVYSTRNTQSPAAGHPSTRTPLCSAESSPVESTVLTISVGGRARHSLMTDIVEKSCDSGSEVR
jgi:hypothetical protein